MNTAIKQTKSFKFASNVIGRDVYRSDELTRGELNQITRFLIGNILKNRGIVVWNSEVQKHLFFSAGDYMANQVIPLTTSPNNTFTCTVAVNGEKKKFYFFLRYNTEARYWVMDLSDENKVPIVSSIPLISGINLLEQYEYLQIGKAYLVKTDDSLLTDIPDDTNLSTDFALLWLDND